LEALVSWEDLARTLSVGSLAPAIVCVRTFPCPDGVRDTLCGLLAKWVAVHNSAANPPAPVTSAPVSTSAERAPTEVAKTATAAEGAAGEGIPLQDWRLDYKERTVKEVTELTGFASGTLYDRWVGKQYTGKDVRRKDGRKSYWFQVWLDKYENKDRHHKKVLRKTK